MLALFVILFLSLLLFHLVVADVERCCIDMSFMFCRWTMYSLAALVVTAVAVVGVRGHTGHHGSDNVMQMNQQQPPSFHDPSVVGNQE